MVVHQGNVSYTLPGAVYLAREGGKNGKGRHLAFVSANLLHKKY